MRKIVKILHVMEWEKDGKKHAKTIALLDSGDEVVGYGKDFKVGDAVQAFHDDKWDVTKMQKVIDKDNRLR